MFRIPTPLSSIIPTSNALETRVLRGLRNFRFLPISKDTIHEQQRKVVELVKRFEIKEAIYFDTAMDRANPPHVPHRLPPRKRWIVVHVRKKYACIIGCETILARVESRFITCQLFQIKENLLLLALARARTFLLCLKEGRNFFFLSFSWIHLNEPRMQLKRYTWTVGKIF